MSTGRKRSGRNRKRKPGRLIFPALVVVTVLLVFSSIVLTFLLMNRNSAGVTIDASYYYTTQRGFDTDYAETQKMYPFEDVLIKLSSSRISVLSVAGDELYAFDVNMEQPHVVQNDAYALVYDLGGHTVALLEKGRIRYTKSLSNVIRYATVSAQGECAFILEEDEAFGIVHVLDKNGAFLASWRSVDAGFPIAIAFSPKSDFLSVSLIDTSASHLQTRLRQFEFLRDQAELEIREFAAYDVPADAAVPFITYAANDIPVLYGDRDIYYLHDASMLSSPTTFEQIIKILPVDSGLIVFYAQGVGQSLLVASVGDDMATNDPLVLGSHFQDADYLNGQLIVARDEKLMLIEFPSMRLVKSFDLAQTVIRLAFIDENTVMLVTQTGVREFHLAR